MDMKWLENLTDSVKSAFAKTEAQKAADEADYVSAASKRVVTNMRDMAEEYDKISNTDVKAATNHLLSGMGIQMTPVQQKVP